MKKLNTALVVPCILLAGNASAEIIISEVIEGSSYNKAIEIANVSDQRVTLTGYKLQKQTNSEGEWASDFPLDHVKLDPFQTYVIGNNQADEELLAKVDEEDGTVVNFNGDDPLRLVLNEVAVDTFGTSDGGDFHSETTYVRCDYTPTDEWDEAQWFTLSQDDWTVLGHIEEECEIPEPPPSIEATIMELQGEGSHSPYTDPANGEYESDEVFEVTGIITHVQTANLGSDLQKGFFIQDQAGDDNLNTSDAIFVNANPTGLNVGDEVVVTGTVLEHYYWTQINSFDVETTGTTGVSIKPTTITAIDSDENFAQTLERHEDMLVRVNSETDMRITRTFSYDYDASRNNMVLAHSQVNLHPNQFNAPLSEGSQEQNEKNADHRLFVESPTVAEDGVVPWYPEFGQDNGTGTTENYLRIGAGLNEEGLTGVMGYSYNEYRLYVNNEATRDTFTNNERTSTPSVKEGQLSVASFNVLNFFTSEFGGGRTNPMNDNRGAESAEDYAVQLEKIVSALVALDADIYGLIEIENNGFDEQSAIYTLVEALNSRLDEEDHYTIATPGDLGEEGYVGTDAITNKIIYRANRAELNDTFVIDMPQQHVDLGDGSFESNYQRDALNASFKVEGAKEDLIISTNHFKSKGSTCWEDEQSEDQLNDVNLQGSCEQFRVSAAYHLAEELNKVDGYKVLMGDLNNYGLEDAMIVLTNREHAPEGYETHAARDTYIGGDQESGTPLHGAEGALIEHSYGYVDMVEVLKPGSYSYSYDDSVGTLDYVLVDSELQEFVVDAEVWSINAVESSLFEYSTKYSGDLPKYGDAYRSSDHDPAIIVFEFNPQDNLQLEESGASLNLYLLVMLFTGLFARRFSK